MRGQCHIPNRISLIFYGKNRDFLGMKDVKLSDTAYFMRLKQKAYILSEGAAYCMSKLNSKRI